MISVIFLFSSGSVSRDPSVWHNYYPMRGPGSTLQTMDCYSPTAQKLRCCPNNCMSPSYYPFSYPLPNFILLRFFATRNSCMQVAVLFVNATKQSRQFSKSMMRRRAGIMSAPIHRSVWQPFRKSNRQGSTGSFMFKESSVQQGYCIRCHFS